MENRIVRNTRTLEIVNFNKIKSKFSEGADVILDDMMPMDNSFVIVSFRVKDDTHHPFYSIECWDYEFTIKNGVELYTLTQQLSQFFKDVE